MASMVRRSVLSSLSLFLLLTACAQKEPEADLPSLVAALKRPDEIGRGRATTTLVTLGERAVPAIVPLLSDPEPSIRRVAVATLWGMGAHARAAVPQLVNALSDEDSAVRGSAVMALQAIGTEATEAVPALTRALRDRDDNVRLWAVKALGSMGPAAAAALPTLERMVKNDYLGPSVAEAIRQIRADQSVAAARARERQDHRRLGVR